MKEARYYRRDKDGKIRCSLCPHSCLLGPGQTGDCGIRRNNGEILEAAGYGIISSLAVDPVEKKPLYHFYPGSRILSVGGFGCNFRCDFCQNFEISQIQADPPQSNAFIDPRSLAERATQITGNIGLAFTYNEPLIAFEYVLDTARILKEEAGMQVVLVSNGFVQQAPLRELLPSTDAWNVDIKSFNRTFYRNYCHGELQPVLKTAEMIRSAGKHLEITCLVITGRNDSTGEMVELTRWISGNLGRETVLHLSRYYPRYKSREPATPPETMELLYMVAKENLDNVYTGNLPERDGNDSTCPGCGTVYIRRAGYRILQNSLVDNQCPQCGKILYGKF
ncbi:MAG: AmmeMemoRadiSam system radical SAM enzyme [Bacteroidota bacterium]